MIRPHAFTPDEAAKILCGPSMAREAYPRNCFGPKCAAWRWTTGSSRMFYYCSDEQAKDEPDRPSSVPPSWTWNPYRSGHHGFINYAGWEEPDEEAAKRDKGYCGLAGVQP